MACAGVQVPHGAPDVVREDLSQMMHGAATELQAAGCRIAGGHSCLGAELALGFTVTGHAPEGGLMLKGGLRAGQALVLTKAVGTGLVMRAGMLRAASARALTAAWRSMAQSNGGAAAVLRGAGVAACTDVTGFGLLGHALEMAEASEVCHCTPNVHHRRTHGALRAAAAVLQCVRAGTWQRCSTPSKPADERLPCAGQPEH